MGPYSNPICVGNTDDTGVVGGSVGKCAEDKCKDDNGVATVCPTPTEMSCREQGTCVPETGLCSDIHAPPATSCDDPTPNKFPHHTGSKCTDGGSCVGTKTQASDCPSKGSSLWDPVTNTCVWIHENEYETADGRYLCQTADNCPKRRFGGVECDNTSTCVYSSVKPVAPPRGRDVRPRSSRRPPGRPRQRLPRQR